MVPPALTILFFARLFSGPLEASPAIVVRGKISLASSSKAVAMTRSPWPARSTRSCTASRRRKFGSLPDMLPEMSTIAARSLTPVGGLGLTTFPATSVAIWRVTLTPLKVKLRLSGPL